MRKMLDIALRPEKIQFTGNCIRIVDFHSGKYKIPYKGIVLACLYVCDHESGICYEPEFTEITADMEGELVIYDSGNSRFKIKTDLTGKRAGALLLEIAFHVPYILLGSQPWLDVKSEADFLEAGNMVKLMQQC